MVFNAEINVCYRTGLYRNAPREIIGALPVVFYDRVLCLVISLMKVFFSPFVLSHVVLFARLW